MAEDSGVTAHLYGVFGDDPSNVWAVGEGGTLLHKDGPRWQVIPTDTSATLSSVVGTPEGVFVAGGSSSLLRWDGAALVRESTSCTQPLLGVARSGADLIGVGEGYCMTRRRAGVWSALPLLSTPPTDKSGNFSVVTSNGSTTWVSGRPGNLYRFDGTAWSQLELKTMEVASSLLALPSGELWTGGSDLYRVSAPALPTRVNARPQEAIYSLSGASADTLWAAGFQGTILRRSGAAWEPIRSDVTSSLYGIYSPSADVAWAIGFDAMGSTLLRCTNRGCQPAEKPVAGLEYTAIHGVADDTFWIVGKNGLLKSWTPKTNSLVDEVTDLAKGATLNHVFALDAQHVYAVGEQGLVLVRGDTTWTTDTSAPTGRQNLQAVWASSAEDVWVAGTNGFVARFSGKTWITLSSGVSETISAIRGLSSSDVWAVTLQGTVLHFDGQSFSVVTRETLPRLHSIEARDGHVYFAGALGSILHKSPAQ